MLAGKYLAEDMIKNELSCADSHLKLHNKKTPDLNSAELKNKSRFAHNSCGESMLNNSKTQKLHTDHALTKLTLSEKNPNNSKNIVVLFLRNVRLS